MMKLTWEEETSKISFSHPLEHCRVDPSCGGAGAENFIADIGTPSLGRSELYKRTKQL